MSCSLPSMFSNRRGRAFSSARVRLSRNRLRKCSTRPATITSLRRSIASSTRLEHRVETPTALTTSAATAANSSAA